MLTLCYFSGGAIFFSGQHLCDSGHCSCGSNTHVIKVTAGSSSLMTVDIAVVTRSGGGSQTNLSVAVNSHPIRPPPLHFPFHYVLELCFRQVACGSELGIWLWRGFSPHRDMCDKLSWQVCHYNISSSLEEMGETYLSFDQFSAGISRL